MHPMQNLVRMAALALIPAGVLASPVRAQLKPTSALSSETVPLRIRLGVLRPNSSTTRTLSGSQVPGGMVDLSSSRAEDARTLTVGYFQGSTAGKSFRVAPLLVTKTSARASGSSSTSGMTGMTGFFTSEGYGVYFIDAAGSGFKTRFGGYMGAGLRLSGGLFVEAQYHYVSGSVNGASPNGLALFIGRRN
jgi:hypothetical protein